MKLVWEQCKKYQNFTQYPGAQLLFKWTVSADLGQFDQKSVIYIGWKYMFIYILYIWWNNAVFVSALKNLPLDIISNSQLANFSASELERNSKLPKIAEKNEKDLINLVSNWETVNWKRCASFVFHFRDLFRIKVCIRKVNLYFSKNMVVVPRKAAKLENMAWIFCETSFETSDCNIGKWWDQNFYVFSRPGLMLDFDFTL